MKNWRVLGIAVFLSLIAANVSVAQVVDDVYFDPARDRVATQKPRPVTKEQDNYYKDETYQTQDHGYVDDEYDYYNDYDFYYTSRIRRFHRPFYGFGYYDPIYVDAWHYDPFFSPGVTVLIYDDFFSFRDWTRWNRWNNWNRFGWNDWGWNSWGSGWNSWGWNNWGWNSWNRWNSWNPWWGATGFRFSTWGFGGPYYFGGSFVYPPSWGNGYTYNTINDINNNRFYGPRTGGSATGPAPGARNPRGIQEPESVVPRTINTGDRLPTTDRARIPSTERPQPQPGEATPGRAINPGDRFYDRYPPRETESTGRVIGTDRATPNTGANPERATPVNPGRETTPRTYPTYDRNRPETYERPRSFSPPSNSGNTNERARTPQNQTPPRTYTPPSRTPSSSGSGNTYERPRSYSPGSNSGNNSSYERPRSSGFSDSPSRSIGPSSSGSSNSGSSAPRSSGSSSSSSSSGGRIRNN